MPLAAKIRIHGYGVCMFALHKPYDPFGDLLSFKSLPGGKYEILVGAAGLEPATLSLEVGAGRFRRIAKDCSKFTFARDLVVFQQGRDAHRCERALTLVSTFSTTSLVNHNSRECPHAGLSLGHITCSIEEGRLVRRN